MADIVTKRALVNISSNVGPVYMRKRTMWGNEAYINGKEKNNAQYQSQKGLSSYICYYWCYFTGKNSNM